jgi:hypothetical protein
MLCVLALAFKLGCFKLRVEHASDEGGVAGDLLGLANKLQGTQVAYSRDAIANLIPSHASQRQQGKGYIRTTAN